MALDEGGHKNVCIPCREKQRLHGHVQPPSSQPYAVPQGKGSALADAVAAGRLGLHAAGACTDQQREHRRHPGSRARAGACWLHRTQPRAR